jgi:hypothetical protein
VIKVLAAFKGRVVAELTADAEGLRPRRSACREQQPATQEEENERAAPNETSIDPAQGGPPRRRHEPCVWCLPSRETYRQRSAIA